MVIDIHKVDLRSLDPSLYELLHITSAAQGASDVVHIGGRYDPHTGSFWQSGPYFEISPLSYNGASPSRYHGPSPIYERWIHTLLSGSKPWVCKVGRT